MYLLTKQCLVCGQFLSSLVLSSYIISIALHTSKCLLQSQLITICHFQCRQCVEFSFHSSSILSILFYLIFFFEKNTIKLMRLKRNTHTHKTTSSTSLFYVPLIFHIIGRRPTTTILIKIYHSINKYI